MRRLALIQAILILNYVSNHKVNNNITEVSIAVTVNKESFRSNFRVNLLQDKSFSTYKKMATDKLIAMGTDKVIETFITTHDDGHKSLCFYSHCK